MADDPLDILQRYALRRPSGKDVLDRARQAWDQPSGSTLDFPAAAWLAVAALVAMAVDAVVVRSLDERPAPILAQILPADDRAYVEPALVTPAQRNRPVDPAVTVAALNRHLENLP